MNVVVTCKYCNLIVASVNKKNKKFREEMQKQLAVHRKEFPDHNWFDEKEGLV